MVLDEVPPRFVSAGAGAASALVLIHPEFRGAGNLESEIRRKDGELRTAGISGIAPPTQLTQTIRNYLSKAKEPPREKIKSLCGLRGLGGSILSSIYDAMYKFRDTRVLSSVAVPFLLE